MQTKIGDYMVGDGQPLLLIAGPCMIESESLCRVIAGELCALCAARGINYIFKGSFDKANRTSVAAGRGPGIEAGLDVLAGIRDAFGVPVTTDVHERDQAGAVAGVCQLLQIPAFLCRQTDLLLAAAAAAGEHGGAVNVKKGQFMAPEDMRHAVDKVRQGGCDHVLVTERGTTFGYANLVVDFRGCQIMRQWAPACFDATHSVQKPGGGGDHSGGDSRFVPALVRAAMAVGYDALFIETHPDPSAALSDGPNMVALRDMPALLDGALRLRAAARD